MEQHEELTMNTTPAFADNLALLRANHNMTQEQLAERLGVPFVNLLDEETGVDFAVDCYDGVGHLNPDGASKTTAWLGRWLCAHYPLDDHRGDPAYVRWHERLAQYEAFRAAQWDAMAQP